MAVAHGRYKFLTVSLLKRFVTAVSRFAFKTAVRAAVSEVKPPPGSRSGFKIEIRDTSALLELLENSRYNTEL
jgi:hypothetical protein